MTEQTNKSERLDQRNKKKNKRKKPKKTKKLKKRRRERSSSSSSSEDDMKSMHSNNTNPGFASTFPYFNPIHSANYNLPIHYPSNPYFYPPPFDPPFTCNPGHGYYTPQRGNHVSNPVINQQQTCTPHTNAAKFENIVSLVDSHQNISNNTNVFEDPAPFGSLDVHVTTNLTPPKSIENKPSNHEQLLWSNLHYLANSATEQNNENN